MEVRVELGGGEVWVALGRGKVGSELHGGEVWVVLGGGEVSCSLHLLLCRVEAAAAPAHPSQLSTSCVLSPQGCPWTAGPGSRLALLLGFLLEFGQVSKLRRN